MKPNNRITYRFDVRERQPAKDKPEHRKDAARHKEAKQDSAAGRAQPSHNNVIPLYQQIHSNVIDDVQPWNNGYQEDIGALEQLIRDADAGVDKSGEAENEEEGRNKAAGQNKDALVGRSQEEDGHLSMDRRTILSFDAGMGVPAGNDDFSPSQEIREERGASTFVAPSTRRSGGRGPSWLHVFLSVSGALATGAIFGYLILALFTGASIWPGGDAKIGVESQTIVKPEGKETIGLGDLTGLSEGGKDGEGDGEAGGDIPATVNMRDASNSYTFLQFGVFSNTEGRDAGLKQLKERGLAAASMKTEEGYRVFAGIALDGAKATIISAGLPDIALYKKEVSVRASERLVFSGGEKAANAFFASTNELIGTWSDLVVAQLEQPSLSPLSAAASEGWRTRHEGWAANAGVMQEGLSDDKGKAYFAKLEAAMNAVAASMAEYDRKPSKSHLWSAETSLMEAVLAQKEWFESVSAL